MTELQQRQEIVSILQGWVGKNEADGSHKEIIDIYNNGPKPLPRNYAVQYDDPWCATTYSAAVIVAGFTDIMPVECSCGSLIELAKEMGCWVEDDGYIPAPGDGVLYDWADKADYATTDNKGWPDHVGTVEKIVGNVMTIIEGNCSNKVKRRNLKVNGRYIRGFITPKFGDGTKHPIEVVTSGDFKIGDAVNFTGSTHYKNSGVSAKGVRCASGKARITAINKNGAHPYHLIAVTSGGSNVYGWVDAKDIEGATDPAKTEIKVGDTVKYTGDLHYTSSYRGATGKKCKGGTAKVTAIKKGNPHPYHIVSSGKGCTVHGWVDADLVTKQ